MREILFRAKRTDNGKWIEGYVVKFDFGAANIYRDETYNGKLFTGIYHVDSSTICQYTGLQDKNGKKIFENDIVRCGGNMMISWREDKASWTLRKDGWLYSHFFGESVEPEDVEVIGNIFDHPELF